MKIGKALALALMTGCALFASEALARSAATGKTGGQRTVQQTRKTTNTKKRTATAKPAAKKTDKAKKGEAPLAWDAAEAPVESGALDAKAIMEDIRIPKLEIEEATPFDSVCEILHRASKNGNGKLSQRIPITERGVNFVIVTSGGTCEKPCPEIKREDITLSEAVNLVCEKLDLAFEIYGQRTLVFHAKGGKFSMPSPKRPKNLEKAKALVAEMRAADAGLVFMPKGATLIDGVDWLRNTAASKMTESGGVNFLLKMCVVDGDMNFDAPKIRVMADKVSVYDALYLVCASASAHFAFIDDSSMIEISNGQDDAP